MSKWANKERAALLDQLEEWGYEPKRISLSGLSETEYYEFVFAGDPPVRQLQVNSNEHHLTRHSWKSPEHGVYVKTWLDGETALNGEADSDD